MALLEYCPAFVRNGNMRAIAFPTRVRGFARKPEPLQRGAGRFRSCDGPFQANRPCRPNQSWRKSWMALLEYCPAFVRNGNMRAIAFPTRVRGFARKPEPPQRGRGRFRSCDGPFQANRLC